MTDSTDEAGAIPTPRFPINTSALYVRDEALSGAAVALVRDYDPVAQRYTVQSSVKGGVPDQQLFLIEERWLRAATKHHDPRYSAGASAESDAMDDDEWFARMGAIPMRGGVNPLPKERSWIDRSITGGVELGAQPNATVDGNRVVAVYVEDRQSDEYARMFECFFPDGTVDYVADAAIELDDDESGDA